MYPITLKIQTINKWLGNMYHALSITINYTMEICKWKSLWTGMADSPPLLHHITKVAKLMNSDCASHPLLAAVSYPQAAGTQPQSRPNLDWPQFCHNSSFSRYKLLFLPCLVIPEMSQHSQEHKFKTSFSPRCLHFFWYSDIKSAQGNSVVSGPSPPRHYYLTLT